MADDKDLERQYRKNLMVVASIVLIYSIAGGEMGDAITMLGANLKFNRPDWLEYAMVAVMCFFCWRHLQVSGFLRTALLEDAFRGIILDCVLVSRIMNQGVKDGYSLHAGVEGYRVGREPAPDDDDDGCYYAPYISLRGVNSILLSIIIGERTENGKVIGCRDLHVTDASTRFKIWWLLIISFIKKAILKPEFGDGILPSLVTLAALLAWSFNFVCNLLVW